jgi:hypothetical protein
MRNALGQKIGVKRRKGTKVGNFAIGEVVEYDFRHFMTGRVETLRGEIVHATKWMPTYQIRRSAGQPHAGKVDFEIEAAAMRKV